MPNLPGKLPVQGERTAMPEFLATFRAQKLNLLTTGISYVCGQMGAQI
jgi:hypothetical protein